MLREFYCAHSCRTRLFAACGLVVFVAHQGFRAYLKYAINEWYGRFYDTLQQAVERLSAEPPLALSGIAPRLLFGSILVSIQFALYTQLKLALGVAPKPSRELRLAALFHVAQVEEERVDARAAG